MPSMVDGHVHRTFAPVVAEVAGAHVERQPFDLSTAANHSALAVGVVTLIESYLERRPPYSSGVADDAWRSMRSSDRLSHSNSTNRYGPYSVRPAK